MFKNNLRLLFVTLAIPFIITYCGGGGGGDNTPPNYTPYYVTYDANGADSGFAPYDNNFYYQDQTVTVLGNTESMVKAHYSFSGWNTQSNGGGTTYTIGQTFQIGTSNVTLYANWTANPTYTVTYLANGAESGDVPEDNTHYEQGQTVTVLGNIGNLDHSTYGFVYWNTANNGSGTTYSKGRTFIMGSSNVTLYAIWKNKNYVAGSYNDGTNHGACYWANGLLVPLHNGTSGAFRAFKQGTDIYVTGQYNNGTNDIACYWKNGTKTDQITLSNCGVGDMFISGTDVYAVGYYISGTYRACYWLNGTRYELPGTNGGVNNSYAHRISISGSDVYISGDYFSAVSIPCYWKNGTIYYLPQMQVANAYTGAIFATSADVYTSGYHYYNNQRYLCYWKNYDNPVDISLSTSLTVYSIFVSGTDVYMAGWWESGSEHKACYWKNGVRTELPSDNKNSYAFSIFVSGTDIYIAGTYQDGFTTKACYWINDIKIDLCDSSSSASYILVVNP
jgi:uncharacterized repeat protein (TIGR02543 family)